MAGFKASDGGYLFNAEQFHVTRNRTKKTCCKFCRGLWGSVVVNS